MNYLPLMVLLISLFTSAHAVSSSCSGVFKGNGLNSEAAKESSGLVVLRNGSEEFRPLVVIINLSLRDLAKSNPIGLYELFEKAKDPKHKFWSEAIEGELKSHKLVESNGTINSSIRNIVISSLESIGVDFKLVSPFKEVQRVEDKDVAIEHMSEAQLKNYYQRAISIVEFIKNQMDESGRNSSEKIESPNPYFNQIKDNGGIALEMNYSTPSALWTPWGKLSIRGYFGMKKDQYQVMEELIEKFGLEVIVPVEYTEQGQFGPIYKFTKDFDGNPIPAVHLKGPNEMTSYERANEAWDKLHKDTD